MYVRLVNLTDTDEVVSDGSLSYNHVMAEGNQEYYFILRDDINFAAVKDGAAVDTGELVSAEDVVFSLNRAKMLIQYRIIVPTAFMKILKQSKSFLIYPNYKIKSSRL